MNADALPTKNSEPIRLCDVDDFEIGAIHIHPSLREVVIGGVAITIEPRVMEVFVALAQADGRVVSRSELMSRCWGGRAVGEDAMNRCIAKVRRMLKPGAVSGLRLETVPRIGYRLVSAGPGFALAGVKILGASPYIVALLLFVAIMSTLAVEWGLTHRW